MPVAIPFVGARRQAGNIRSWRIARIKKSRVTLNIVRPRGCLDERHFTFVSGGYAHSPFRKIGMLREQRIHPHLCGRSEVVVSDGSNHEMSGLVPGTDV